MSKEDKTKDSEDDDMSFDFSKIKNFFSKSNKGKSHEAKEDSKASEKASAETHDSKHSETEKKTEHTQHHTSHKEKASSDDDDSDVSFDFSKFKSFFSSSKLPILLTLLLVLIPVLLTINLRLAPDDLPAAENWAQSSVDNYFRSQIAAQVNQQYPNLPQQNKDELINQQYDTFKTANQAALDQQTAQTAEFFKQGFRYEENGYTYTFLGDLDSYYYLRQARNLAEKGMLCDEIKDGVCVDNHMFAPIGYVTPISLHPYGIYYLHKILHTVKPSVNLMQSAFLLPTVISVLAAIAAFFIGRKMMNEVAGFFAAMFLTLSPMFLSRTLGSDTDVWNVMFALVIFWIFLEAFEASSNMKRIILALASGFALGLFSFAWSGWWYIFFFIMIAIIAYCVIEIIKNSLNKKSVNHIFNLLKPVLILFVVVVISAGILVSLFSGFESFKGSFMAPINLLTGIKSATQADLWPNVYTTVAELNEAGLDTVVSQSAFGNKAFFAIGLIGVILTMVKRKPDLKEYLLIGATIIIAMFLVSNSGFGLGIYMYLVVLAIPIGVGIFLNIFDKDSQIDIKPAIILAIWFAGMIFASTKGIRFILLLIPALAVAFGVAIGYIWQYISRICADEFNMSQKIAKVGLFLILCLILVAPFNIGVATAESFVPSMNKGWWDTLTKIKTESKPDAIINSWWDFGHWFKYVADRQVTLDGASQNHPNAHWLGLLLQTDDEELSVGILRMLDCGSNNAFVEVDKRQKDTEKSENIIQELLLMSASEAKTYLSNLGYTAQEIEAISKNMYCNPPENYLITSEDMVGKAGVWAHFGLWNFDRSYMVTNVKPATVADGTQLLKERFGYSDEEATNLYYELQSLTSDRAVNDWVAPWPNYVSSRALGCQIQNKTRTDNRTNTTFAIGTNLICPVNIVISQDAASRTVIEGLVFDADDYDKSDLVIGIYDTAGTRRGGANVKPKSLLVLEEDNETTRVIMTNSTFGYDIVVDTLSNRILISAPELSGSMFTKLFFFDGAGTTRFEKFSDVTDITGQRIIVWKVKW